MPEKQKTRNWKHPKTIIAAVSVTMLVTIWNTFATHDRGRTGDTDSLISTPSTRPGEAGGDVCPTPAQTKDREGRCLPVTSTKSS